MRRGNKQHRGARRQLPRLFATGLSSRGWSRSRRSLGGTTCRGSRARAEQSGPAAGRPSWPSYRQLAPSWCASETSIVSVSGANCRGSRARAERSGGEACSYSFSRGQSRTSTRRSTRTWPWAPKEAGPATAAGPIAVARECGQSGRGARRAASDSLISRPQQAGASTARPTGHLGLSEAHLNKL